MAESSNRSRPDENVLTQVCLSCGKEYFYESDAPPRDQTCERCGGHVFRSYYAVVDGDEVEQDFQDATARDTATDDPGTDITQGDLHDLNNP